MENKKSNGNSKIIEESEEIRCWFKVSSNRKKVRNIELWILEELKKICKKHNIKYYADWGTLLWTIRHKWYIPWDDDVDLVMFREDYERFLKIAEKELPENIKIWRHYLWHTKLINIDTAALWNDNLLDKDFIGWIRIDIFPIDYASKFKIINRIKSNILLFLRMILLSQKSSWDIGNMKKWKKFFTNLSKSIFSRIDCTKVYNLHERIGKKVFFKWNKIYESIFLHRFYPENIYNSFQETSFENTTICIPKWYDTYLKIAYWDYMTPIIFKWWHNCRYSVDKSYKDIIKTFDKSKSNEENYKNCKELFLLE